MHNELTECMHVCYVLSVAMTNVCYVNIRRRAALPIAGRGGARG